MGTGSGKVIEPGLEHGMPKALHVDALPMSLSVPMRPNVKLYLINLLPDCVSNVSVLCLLHFTAD